MLPGSRLELQAKEIFSLIAIKQTLKPTTKPILSLGFAQI